MALPTVEEIFSPWKRILITIVLSFLAIFGVLRNLAVCLTFNRSKHLRTSASILIVNLAVADTLESLNMAFMIAAINNDKWFRINGLCQMNALSHVTLIGTSILTLSLICINRYFLVTTLNRSFFSRKNTFFFTVFVWFIPAAFAVFPVLGWSKYKFKPGYLSCLLDFNASLSYMIIYFATFLLIPMTVMSFCSWKIIVTVKRNRQRVQQTPSLSRTFEEERRVTTMLFAVIISFATFYTPISTVNFMEVFNGGKYRIEPSIEVSTIMITMLNHVNNPIIYGLLNRNFRGAFLEVIHSLDLY